MKRFSAGVAPGWRASLRNLGWVAITAVVSLSGCGGGDGGGGGGGGGGGSGGGGSSSGSSNARGAGVILSFAHFVAQWQSPRSGTDPGTGAPYPDVQGTTLEENNWLRS